MPQDTSSTLVKNLQMHGSVIAPVTQSVQALLNHKRLKGQAPKLTKHEKMLIASEIAARENSHIVCGVDFSRIQIDEVLHQRDSGAQIEFETLGPYLADYVGDNGIITAGNIIPEDMIGLELSKLFRTIFPKGRVVSLIDEYNTISAHNRWASNTQTIKKFSAANKKNITESLISLYKSVGTLQDKAIEGKEYLLLEESSKIASAPILIERLESLGYIQRKGQEITFYNALTENPLHQSFRLRTSQGRWLCEALDASAFLKPINKDITHIVALPQYMKDQQDRVWEMLRLLDIIPHKYHNIFYEPNQNPIYTVCVIEAAFEKRLIGGQLSHQA